MESEWRFSTWFQSIFIIQNKNFMRIFFFNLMVVFVCFLLRFSYNTGEHDKTWRNIKISHFAHGTTKKESFFYFFWVLNICWYCEISIKRCRLFYFKISIYRNFLHLFLPNKDNKLKKKSNIQRDNKYLTEISSNRFPSLQKTAFYLTASIFLCSLH